VKRHHFLIIAFAFLAAAGGAFMGRQFARTEQPMANQFHTFVHHELNLDPEQQRKIEILERNYAAVRRRYEADMRGDNRLLAHAIQAEKGYGPQVAQAIDLSHHAMGGLQKETLRHLFAMRAVLKPDQAARFDKALVDSLTSPER
jgi:nickel and cobalt resistance protein CnrR